MADFNKKATNGGRCTPILAQKSDPLHILQMVKNLKHQPITGVTDEEILLRARNLAQLESFCGFLPIWKGSKSPMLKYGGEPHLSLQEALGFKPAALAVRSPNLLTLDDRNLAIFHEPDLIDDFLMQNENIDVVVHGHTHRYRKEIINGVLFFNPGECAGMKEGRNAIGILNLKSLETKRIFF